MELGMRMLADIGGGVFGFAIGTVVYVIFADGDPRRGLAGWLLLSMGYALGWWRWAKK